MTTVDERQKARIFKFISRLIYKWINERPFAYLYFYDFSFIIPILQRLRKQILIFHISDCFISFLHSGPIIVKLISNLWTFKWV